MNRYTRLLLTSALTCLMLFSSAQSKSDKSLEKQILGTWGFLKINLELTDRATEEEKAMVQAGMGSSMSMFMENLAYTFKKNGEYEMNNDDQITRGTWKITDGKLIMTSDGESKSDDKPTLITIDKNILTLSSDDLGGVIASLVFESRK